MGRIKSRRAAFLGPKISRQASLHSVERPCGGVRRRALGLRTVASRALPMTEIQSSSPPPIESNLTFQSL